MKGPSGIVVSVFLATFLFFGGALPVHAAYSFPREQLASFTPLLGVFENFFSTIRPAFDFSETPAARAAYAGTGKGICEHQSYQFNNMTKNYPASSPELTAILNNPYIACLQLSYYWAQLEPTHLTYRWDIIDGEIAPFAGVGKKVWIEIKTAPYVPPNTGSGYPLWITQAPYNVPTVGTNDGLGIDPVFWNPTYQSLWESFITAFAARYDGNSNIEFISIGGYSAGTEPGLATTEQNQAHCAEWMAAGLDPGIDNCTGVKIPGDSCRPAGSINRVKTSDFYTIAESQCRFGDTTHAVYSNTVKWMEDMYKRHFLQIPLMRAIHVTDDWDVEANARTGAAGIGWGSNGLSGTNDPTGRQQSSDAQLLYNIPVAFFEFGPKAFQDGTTQLTTLDQYKRAIGISGDPTYGPYSRRSYLPIGDIQSAVETQAEWQAALQWAYDNELNWLGNSSPPPTPTNLTATAFSSTQINLGWSDVANENSYIIQRCQGTGCSGFADVATVGTNVTTYQNSGLLQNTSYSYRVRAHNVAGDSSYSNTATTSTLSAIDTTPPMISVTSPTGGTVSSTVTITAGASDAGSGVFGVQFKVDGVNVGVEDTTPPTYSTVWDSTTVSDGNHTITAYARDFVGNATTSLPVTINVLNNQTLIVRITALPSSGITPLNGVDLRATITGSAVGSINYTFWCDNNSSGTIVGQEPPWDYKRDATSTNPLTAIDICNYSTAKTYVAKVIAERGAAVPATATTTVAVSAPIDTISPSPPSSLSSVLLSGPSVRLLWGAATDNVGVTEYHVFRRTTGGSYQYNTPIAITNASQSSYTDLGVIQNTVYYYVVRAYDAAGNASADSAETSQDTGLAPDATKPTPPPNVRVTTYATAGVVDKLVSGIGSGIKGITSFLFGP